jgi:hypothetical protein
MLIHPLYTGNFHGEIGLFRIITRHNKTNGGGAVSRYSVSDQSMCGSWVIGIVLAFIGEAIGVLERPVNAINLIPNGEDFVNHLWRRRQLDIECRVENGTDVFLS